MSEFRGRGFRGIGFGPEQERATRELLEPYHALEEIDPVINDFVIRAARIAQVVSFSEAVQSLAGSDIEQRRLCDIEAFSQTGVELRSYRDEQGGSGERSVFLFAGGVTIRPQGKYRSITGTVGHETMTNGRSAIKFIKSKTDEEIELQPDDKTFARLGLLQHIKTNLDTIERGY